MSPDKHNRLGIIRAIENPLGFYVLSLLVVEAFIASVLILTDGLSETEVNFLYLGVGLFVLVILVVSFLVATKPENVIFREEAHLRLTKSIVDETLEQNRRVEEILRDARHHYRNENYMEAQRAFEDALDVDPGSDDARLGLALVLGRTNSAPEAVEILTDVIAKNPLFSKAYYNRACIKARDQRNTNTWPKQDWLNDLEKAIELRPEYRRYAVADKDFKHHFEDADFKRVVTRPRRNHGSKSSG